MQQVVSACLNANGAWPIIALVALLVGFVLNRRVKGALSNHLTQANKFSVGGNVSAPVHLHNTGAQATATASENAGGGALSTVADVLQVIGFLILMLQISKVIS